MVDQKMTPLDKLASHLQRPNDFASGYLMHHQEVLHQIDGVAIGNLIRVLAGVRENGRAVWFAGNGGKASICAEFANDLTTALPSTKAIRAFSLMANATALTAAANDFGYKNALVHLADRLVENQDLMVILSGSGNSENIVTLARWCAHNDIDVVGIGRGGALKDLSDHFISIPCEDDGPTEDAMMSILHICQAWFARR